MYIGDYVSGDVNQNWSISITSNGNKLVSEATGTALYCDDGTFTVSSTSASYFGFFDYSWWIPCTSITMNDVKLYTGQNYVIEPTFTGAGGVASNLEEDSPWVTYSLTNASSNPITLEGNIAKTTGFGVNYLKIEHRVTKVTDTFYIRVNPREYRIGVTPVQQEESNWCWAACAEMVGKYYYPASDRDQKDVSDEIKGKTFGLFSKNEMGDYSDIEKGIEYVAYNNCNAKGGFWTYSEEYFCESMEEGKPIVAILGTANTGHAIVIVNCTLAGSVTSPIYNIQYIDPSDAKIKNCTYTELCETGINGLPYGNTVVME